MSARLLQRDLTLTRRAKQAHNDIIAQIIRPAPENPERAFHLWSTNCKCRLTTTNPVRRNLNEFDSSGKTAAY
jgi:hypothetical protein